MIVEITVRIHECNSTHMHTYKSTLAQINMCVILQDSECSNANKSSTINISHTIFTNKMHKLKSETHKANTITQRPTTADFWLTTRVGDEHENGLKNCRSVTISWMVVYVNIFTCLIMKSVPTGV